MPICVEDPVRDIHTDLNDISAARLWMSDICGPHSLAARSPNDIRFNHCGTTLKGMSTTLGFIEYGTEVTIGIRDAQQFNSYSLSLPISGAQELRADGRSLYSDPSMGVIVSPNQIQELCIEEDCKKIQVVISAASMRRTVEDLLQRPIERPVLFDQTMDATCGASAGWWRFVNYCMGELNRGELFSQDGFNRDLERTLIKGLLLAQPNNYTEELKRGDETHLPHYLLRARDYLHENAKGAVRLSELEKVSGVSKFKLFEGFQKFFGSTPMAYLKFHRLSSVREDLDRSHGNRNISEVALSWGFTHLGRFSGEYRKQFGESPSSTQQRAQQSSARAVRR